MPEPSTVPDFFQEESTDALRSQVDWLTREVGLDDAFFARLIETDEQTLTDWLHGDAVLPPGREDALRRFWHMVLHVLSFLNFDQARVRELFQHAVSAHSRYEESMLVPPWSGMPLREYLERVGGPAVEKVDIWVTGLRFGDPFPA